MLAGIIAIALRSIGFVGKLLVRGDRGDRRRAGRGGAGDRRLRGAQVHRSMRSCRRSCRPSPGISVFRWDINIRELSMLGLVGAGGIGVQLEASLNTLAWNQVSLILFLIFATVALSEWVSARVSHAVI